jgi:glycosyltransferase involved in cell wall biosynthesis
VFRPLRSDVNGEQIKSRTLKRVLIHAANLTGAGAKAVCAGLLPSLVSAAPDVSFTVMIPEDLRSWGPSLPANASIRYYRCRRGIWNDLSRAWELFFEVRRVAKESSADVCLTLGDYPPVGLPCPRVVFVQLPVLTYAPEELRGLRDWSRLKYLYLKNHFRITARRAAFVVVQTDVMAKRLSAAYGISPGKIALIPQPVPRHVARARNSSIHSPFSPDAKAVKLTFLAAYYPHKNHEILPQVAAELRRRGLSGRVQIYTTFDLARCPSAKVRQCLQADADVITNLGPVKPAEVGSLLANSSALFLPTVIESYGLVYLEAMSLGLPILTSDRDFAHHMCRSFAHYFDPFDARSIADCIERFCAWEKPANYTGHAQQQLLRFPPDWDAVGQMFLDVLRGAVAANHTAIAGEWPERT